MAEAIFRQHAPFVAGFLARLGVAARHVDDDVLRIFSEVHRLAASAPAAASTKAWVSAIALRIATQRYQLRERSLAPSDGASDPSVDEFLLTLEPELRALFILFELEAEPPDSIAAAFGLTIDAVHGRLHEGQREFRRAYGLCEAASALSVEDEGIGLAAFVDPVSLV